jgi:hypothetical protein
MMSYLIYILLSLFLFIACDSSHDEGWEDSARRLPIHIRIKTTEEAQQRALGDPGIKEQFPLPNVAYIYVLCNSSANGTGASLLQMIGGVANKGKVDLDPKEWEQDDKDPSVYHYGGALNIDLWHLAQSAKVYVAVADREIPGLQLPQNPEHVVYDPSQLSDAERHEFMKNLYATPYNHEVEGKYYGSVNDLNSNTPRVNVMLYHVAARLDLKWNVEEERRKTFALGTLSVSDLPKSCYLFKPTENTDPGTGNGYSDIVVSKFDATTAWSGRKVVYVPQVNDGARNFPVNLSYTNAAASNAPGLKEQAFAFQYKSDVFTTWFNVEANFVKN